MENGIPIVIADQVKSIRTIISKDVENPILDVDYYYETHIHFKIVTVMSL